MHIASPVVRIRVFSEMFSLNASMRAGNTTVVMKVSNQPLYTSELPVMVKLLKNHLPSIFHCQCFNEENLAFSEEMKDTEIGHLFEHILLEYLCMEKLAAGAACADYSGVTSWNWVRDARGTFHIKITVGQGEVALFKRALHKSLELMRLILVENQLHVGRQPVN